jgi:putative SOS response-associated peptidase YedK
LAPEEVIARAGTTTWENRDQYRPSHNVAPGTATPVIHLDRGGEPIIETMRWGLVPSFTKPTEKPDFWRMFNARSESIQEKPSFRRLVPSRRCIVFLNGFFEWKKEGKYKQPYYIYLVNEKTGEEEPMAMAGLWDVWYHEGPGEETKKTDDVDGGGDGNAVQPREAMHTYTILTTESSPELQWLHDRMPVILKDEQAHQIWLDTTNTSSIDKLHSILGPYTGKNLKWHPVSREMSNLSFQGPEAYQEIKKPSIQKFFQPQNTGKIVESGSGGSGGGGVVVEKKEEEEEEQEARGTLEKDEGVEKEKEREANVAPTPNTDEAAQSPSPSPSPAAAPATAAAATTPGSGHKRKVPASSSTPASKSNKKKKERPVGQPDIASFFSKSKK